MSRILSSSFSMLQLSSFLPSISKTHKCCSKQRIWTFSQEQCKVICRRQERGLKKRMTRSNSDFNDYSQLWFGYWTIEEQKGQQENHWEDILQPGRDSCGQSCDAFKEIQQIQYGVFLVSGQFCFCGFLSFGRLNLWSLLMIWAEVIFQTRKKDQSHFSA